MNRFTAIAVLLLAAGAALSGQPQAVTVFENARLIVSAGRAPIERGSLVVQNGRVLGPPKDHLVLEGIRYGLLEALCADAGIPFELRRVSREEVLSAQEIMLTSATKEILPCTVLDGRPVGNGRPGPIYDKLFAAYQQAKRKPS